MSITTQPQALAHSWSAAGIRQMQQRILWWSTSMDNDIHCSIVSTTLRCSAPVCRQTPGQ